MDLNFTDGSVIKSLQKMQLMIGPRPGKKSFNDLAGLNLSHCCTLLSEREDVQPIKKICHKLECAWIWLPIDGGKLDTLRQTDMGKYFHHLVQQTCETPEPRLYFHCSAGIHRTGYFVYILLRLRGLDRGAAFDELRQIRAVTAEQVGEDRIALADEFIANFLSSA